jgi:hypothetical protein
MSNLSGGTMRWDRLFGDLEGQWEAEARRDLDQEVADRTRRERATVGLYERLAASVGEPVGLRLVAGPPLAGAVADVGDGWLLLGGEGGAGNEGSLGGEGGRAALVPLPAIVAVTGVGTRASEAALGRRFGLGYALRGLSRDRAVVALTDVTGAVTTGTIDAVGADCFDLSEHAPEEPRRPENITARRLVPFAAVVCLRPAGSAPG